MHISTRAFIPLIVLFAVALLIAAFVLRSSPSTPPEAQYATAQVVRTNIEEVVLASGTVEAAQQVNVGAQVSGQLKSLRVSLGETVKKGQLIAEIDAQTQANVLQKAESALAQTQAQLRARRASLVQIRLKFEREKQLRAGNVNSRESYETARATLETALADIDALTEQIIQARINVDTERVNLEYSRIVAPMDGTVVAIVTKEGQTVNSAQLAPTIIVLATLDTMTVKAQISEADISRLQPNQAVHFTTVGNPDHRFHSSLHTIELAPDSIGNDAKASKNTAANAAPVYYNASFDVPNPGNQLRIAMTVQATIVLAAAKDALVIPAAALGSAGVDGSYQVDVLENRNGKSVVTPRQVRIGIRNTAVEVLDGLQEGERVIVGGAPRSRSEASGALRV